jgi:hypothetical protein
MCAAPSLRQRPGKSWVSLQCARQWSPAMMVEQRARFFYTAKADAGDRIGSKHPTVKPVDLMQWLVRLITPPGGLVLEPFAGSGTTGEAAFREGMRCVMIEREEGFFRRHQAPHWAADGRAGGTRTASAIKAKIADGRIKLTTRARCSLDRKLHERTNERTDQIQRSQEQVLRRRGRTIGPIGLRR